MNDTQFKKSIMRRVYAIWALRRMTTPTMLKFYILTAFLWQSAYYVSLPQVFTNSPAITDVSANYSFALTAFSRTELMTQILFAGIICLALWFANDMYKYAVIRRHHGSSVHV